MKQTITVLVLMVLFAVGCTGHARYHEKKLGDPAQYQAHFPDMDANEDDAVSWQEFKAHFPQTNRDVYEALDLNKDGAVDHDEWHQFKEAHGMRHH